jgi:hypothetical protein
MSPCMRLNIAMVIPGSCSFSRQRPHPFGMASDTSIAVRKRPASNILVAQQASVDANSRRKREKQCLAIVSSVPLAMPADILHAAVNKPDECDIQLLVQHVGSTISAMTKNKEKVMPLATSVFHCTKKSEAKVFGTQELQAEDCGVSVDVFKRETQNHYSLKWAVSRHVRDVLVACCAQSRTVTIEDYTERLGYDSTPMNLKQTASISMPQATSSSDALAIVRSGFGKKLPKPQTSSSTNVFQCQHGWGMVLSGEVNGETKYIILMGEGQFHVQSLLGNTPSPMVRAIAEQNFTPPGAEAAKTLSRIGAIDRHPSNFVVERRILRRRRRKNRKWTSHSSTCCQHKLGTIRMRGAKPLESAVSGIINVTRSINSASHLRDFRKCFWKVCYKRTCPVTGYPDDSVVEQHRHILKWFIPRGPNVEVQRVMLELLAHSEWSDHSQIIVKMPPGTEYDVETIKHKVADGLTEALTYRRWRLYMRKKHGGAEEAICDVSLPLMIHNILTEAYNEFCVMQRGSRRSGSVSNQVANSGADNASLMLPAAMGDSENLPVKFEFDRAAWAAQNDRFRKTGQEFLNSHTRTDSPSALGQCIVLRMIMAPIQVMEKDEFLVGSIKWERQQQALAAKHAAEGSTQFLKRDYMGLVHARGTIQMKGLYKFRLLLNDPRLWMMMPQADMRNDLKVTAFSGINGASGKTERLIAHPNSLPPLRLFLVLDQPELADSIEQISTCMLDRWSRTFLKHNGIRSVLARTKLILFLILYFSNTNHLEITNAQLRRFAKRRVQCHQMQISELSEKIAGMFARRSTNTDPSDSDDSANMADHDGANEDDGNASGSDEEKLGGGGGVWRAWLNMLGTNDIRRAGELFRAAKACVGSELLEECIRKGAIATERRRSGELDGRNSFRMSRGQAARVHAQRQLQVRLAENLASPSQIIDDLVDNARLHQESLEVATTQTRRATRQIATMQSDKVKKELESIQKYRRENNATDHAALTQLAPQSVAHVKHFVANPSPCEGVRLLAQDPHASSIAARDLQAFLKTQGQRDGGVKLLENMRQFWGYLHRDIEDDEVSNASSSTDDSDNVDGYCWSLGCCVCGYDGAQVYAMRNEILLILKYAFHRSHEERRKSLGDGLIFLELKPRLPAALADDAVATFWGTNEDHRFWNISDMSFSPFEPMIDIASEASDSESLGAARGHDELALKAPPKT